MKEFLKKGVQEFLDKQVHTSFIDGKYVPANSDHLIAVINPATEEKIADVVNASADVVNDAVESSVKGFDVWSSMSPGQREVKLLDLATVIETHSLELAQLVTLENGKPVKEALSSDVMGAAKTFRYYAGWATKLTGDTLDISMGQKPGFNNFSFTMREPIGVVAAIVPWNFPLSIASWKLGPALATGCSVVLKPSEETPLSSLYMAKLFMEAGFPPGVVNVLVGDGPMTGQALIDHKSIQKIAFTGSGKTGKMIGQAALDKFIPAGLELGGKSPAIVFEDANKTLAAKGVAAGIFRNAGQVCVAGSRAYIQEAIFDEFLELLIKEAQSMNIADGFAEDVGLGPLVSKTHFDKVMSYVKGADKDGLELIVGGQNPKSKGYFLEPTIYKGLKNDSAICREEVFGPVLIVVPFKDKDDALRLANDSDYGLAGTIWTQDINKAMDCAKKLQSGFLAINGPVRSDPHLPLGGFKQSGLGTDLGKEGVYAFTKLKAVNIIYSSE